MSSVPWARAVCGVVHDRRRGAGRQGTRCRRPGCRYPHEMPSGVPGHSSKGGVPLCLPIPISSSRYSSIADAKRWMTRPPPNVCAAEVFRVASSCRLGRRLGRLVDDVTDTTYHCFARGNIMARRTDGGVEIWIPRGTVLPPQDRHR